MHITSLPMLGAPVILTGETGAGWALGTFNADSAYLLAAVADGHGHTVIWNLLDDDTEAALLALLEARAAIRIAATNSALQTVKGEWPLDWPRCLPLCVHRGSDYDDPDSCLLQSAPPPARTGGYDADKTAGMPRHAGLAAARTGATVAMR